MTSKREDTTMPTKTKFRAGANGGGKGGAHDPVGGL